VHGGSLGVPQPDTLIYRYKTEDFPLFICGPLFNIIFSFYFFYFFTCVMWNLDHTSQQDSWLSSL
jgi:hypothetical protein